MTASTTLVSTCVHPHVALRPEGSITPVPAKKHAFSMENLYIISSADCFFSERPKKHFVTHTARTGHLPRRREHPAPHWYLLSTATQLILEERISRTKTTVLRGRLTAASPKTSLAQNILPERHKSGASLWQLENTARHLLRKSSKPHTPVSTRCCLK